ncbi:MAG: hypothetical protein ACK48H_17075 [Microcystis sp.]|uniref:hypothetical protein n=1 Tax=Microcystis sp. TaxID=1127 RepID=UPI00391B02ED
MISSQEIIFIYSPHFPISLHPTPYTPHPTPHTLHPTPHTPHPTPHTPTSQLKKGKSLALPFFL